MSRRKSEGGVDGVEPTGAEAPSDIRGFNQIPREEGRASQVALVVKNLPVTAGAVRDVRSILESGRSPGGGHGNPLQYSCLENPMDRGAWWATVHRVAKSRT